MEIRQERQDSERDNPRFAYLPVSPGSPGAVEFAAAFGAEHVGGLDVCIGRETIECRVVDYGPGGLLAAQREVVHVEAGLPPPPREPEGPDIREAVREALRTLQMPSALAANPLALGSGTEQRAAYVRQLLNRGVDQCFGDDANEVLMRQVLTHGYLEPAPSHELAAREVSLSRSAYFRRLKLATERLADQIRSEYS